MTSKTPEEIVGLEYDWLASDADGYVALFSTAGGRWAPQEFLEVTDAHDRAIDAIKSTAPRTLARFVGRTQLLDPRSAHVLAASLRRHGEALWPRFSGGRDGTLWYYRALVEAFQYAGGTPVHDELERVVREMEQLAQ